ncbi:MAG: GNAT family N-acetyltransferase [Ruminococcaceae bacterium]|nr:GNAT family N-acetyltransferase [Oscillospiraceae bacterium]
MRRAQIHETDAVIAFYRKLITENAHSPYHPDWRLDIYPTNEQIAAYVLRGEMYVLDADESDASGEYLAAFALSDEPADGYDSVPWILPVAWSDAIVVHLLCVDCAYQRRGIGRHIVASLINICRGMGKQAIRLDVMTKNLPAQKLYTSAGFVYVGRFEITYEDTGTMEFFMYEYDLSEKGNAHHV